MTPFTVGDMNMSLMVGDYIKDFFFYSFITKLTMFVGDRTLITQCLHLSNSYKCRAILTFPLK